MGFIDRIFGRTAGKVRTMPMPMAPRRANPLISVPVYSVFGGCSGAPIPLYMPGEPGWEELCRRKNVPLDSDPWDLADMSEDDMPQQKTASK